MTSPLKIVRLDVENVKRVRAISITPHGDTVILGGKNAQGKTSVLDAIEMVLGGGKSLPLEPIRRGAKQATIVCDLGDLVVERVITKTGTTLTVRDKDGKKQSSPQTLLDALCSRIAFDPLAFSRMDPAAQNEVLRRLLGLDFSTLDQRREALYARRTDVTRDAKSTRARSEGIVVPPSTPAEPVEVSALLARLTEITRAEQAASDRQWRLSKATETVANADQAVTTALAALEAARGRAMAAKMALKALEREEQAPAPTVTAEELQGQIAGAQAVNDNVRRRGERDRLEAEANELEQKVFDLTASIDAIDDEKRAAIAQAAFPVPGLALGEKGPTLNGVALVQASGAEKLRVSVAIGLALNPQLKVLLVRDASLLDAASLEMVSEMAAAAGGQIWLERVGTGDPTAVVISDGQVDESALPANAAEREAS